MENSARRPQVVVAGRAFQSNWKGNGRREDVNRASLAIVLDNPVPKLTDFFWILAKSQTIRAKNGGQDISFASGEVREDGSTCPSKAANPGRLFPRRPEVFAISHIPVPLPRGRERPTAPAINLYRGQNLGKPNRHPKRSIEKGGWQKKGILCLDRRRVPFTMSHFFKYTIFFPYPTLFSHFVISQHNRINGRKTDCYGKG